MIITTLKLILWGIIGVEFILILAMLNHNKIMKQKEILDKEIEKRNKVLDRTLKHKDRVIHKCGCITTKNRNNLYVEYICIKHKHIPDIFTTR